MPYKMKGFPMIEGTEPMKKMKDGAMKKMHASPTKAMSPMKDDNLAKLELRQKEVKKLPKLELRQKKVATGSIPQTISRKDPSTDINPQSNPKKKMHDGAMKKMHDGAMKAMKAPMKKMEGAMKAMHGAMKAMSPKKMAHSPKNMGHSPTKAMSPKKKLDSPETQAKIKKMIISGIEKGMNDRDIRNKIDEMSDGSLDYIYNRKNKEVTIKKGGSTGFEGLDEKDPDQE